jgi:Ca2+-binding RTX toxin-like protein
VVRAYFAAVSHVDHEIGRVLTALQASAFAGNTTVILLSDNGFNLGNHDSFHKMSQWDSAAHVPLCIWSARMGGEGREVAMPVSLHNLPKTVLDLAGVPARPGWVSGQSMLPLIDASFGQYDNSRSPVTSVFGTLSVRPSLPALCHLRYFRYPNGEEHVYDLVADPGETRNLLSETPDTVPLAALREELLRGALLLGLDLRGMENPAAGVNAMMAVDGSVVMAGGQANNDYWAYGEAAEQISETTGGGCDTLWYMGGPDDFVLNVPINIEKVRIATVMTMNEKDPSKAKRLRIVAHPDSQIHFETSERVSVRVRGSRKDDVFIGAQYANSTFYGGAGNDAFHSITEGNSVRHFFYGGADNDTLRGGRGDDKLSGGSGDDHIFGGRSGDNLILAGHGNDLIEDGKGHSVIHTGPGRNHVTSRGGNDQIHVGTGENDITCGPGDVTFFVAYGGVTRIHGWRDSYRLNLSSWPADPQLRHSEGTLRLHLGLSVVEIMGVRDPDEVMQRLDLATPD